MPARTIDDLRTPALVCHRSVMEANAHAMRERAERLGCALRPHVKTAKTLEAAMIQTGGTKRRVVVSTLAEAEFLADGGFDDILYAVPITEDKFAAADQLNRRLESFQVMADHPVTVEKLTARTVAKPLSVVVMVDCGYHRDGVDPQDERSVALVQACVPARRTVRHGLASTASCAPDASCIAGRLCTSASTLFGGIYTHGGHSYDAKGAAGVVPIAEAERDVTVGFADRLRAAGVEVPIVGVGSTPTCSLPPDHLNGVDEMHPGARPSAARPLRSLSAPGLHSGSSRASG